MSNGQLKAIWIKRARRGPMDATGSADLVAGRGIAGNTDQSGHRQVTVMESDVWADLMNRFNSDLPPSARRANLLVEGIELARSRNRILRIGNCRLRIHGETKPCERLNEALPGLKEAMYNNWSGGAFGEVLDDGQISVGDVVVWED
ncbi:MAG: MOSC domain-containing protein [Acidobacteriota bacterium]